MNKFKEHKKTILITSIVTILPIIVGLILWNKLPNEFATHFDANGNADGWTSKAFAVFGLPFLILGIHLLCIFATCMDPKSNKVGDKIFKLVLWIVPAISWFASLATYTYNMGKEFDMSTAPFILLGILFILIGNYLPKCRQNYTIGIKIPWTLNDEENWNHTHRLAGKLWMICGAIFVIVALLGSGQSWLLPVIAGVMVLVPIVYSFIFYVKHK